MHAAPLILAFLCMQDGREHLPGWNASFAIPSGWRVIQRSARAVALTDSLESGIVLVTAALMRTRADALSELSVLFQDLHYNPTSTSTSPDTTIGAFSGFVASYSGAAGRGAVETRAAVAITAFGTGVMVLGMATPDRVEKVKEAVQKAAASIQAAAPVTNTVWLGGLSGHWDLVPPDSGQASTEEWFEFDGRERFSWHSRIVVRLSGAAPIEAEAQRDSGSYTVIGRTLVLRGAAKVRALEIELDGAALRLSGRPFRRQAP